MYHILTDEDISRLLSTDNVIGIIDQTLSAKAQGALVAPPRFSVGTDAGNLVFTAGAESAFSNTIGFRVYETFSNKNVEHHQLVVVFDSQTGEFKGLVIGKQIGALRTAAINAVAIKYMARSDSEKLGILGSGFQARFHAQAAMSVRQFKQAKIYSSTPGHREAFAQEMSDKFGIQVETAGSPKDVVEFADVLICATTSTTPVLEADWVAPGTHVNSVGPKFQGQSEIPYGLARKSHIIVTDSLQQVDSYAKPFFLLGTPERERMIELSELVAGKQMGRLASDEVTLFCSVGLAGTEVVLANQALHAAEPS